MPTDFSIGSYCSKLTKLDALESNLIGVGGFLDEVKTRYTTEGCNGFFSMIAHINAFPGIYGSAYACGQFAVGMPPIYAGQQPNALGCLETAKRKAKIDYCECMLIQVCKYHESDFGIKYGCMDNGARPLSYINNRGTWNFLLKNNTTSSGVVARPDGTQLPGLQQGSAYPPPFIPGQQFPYPANPALNFDVDATLDDGRCVYDTASPLPWTAGLPYHLEGCMDSTPHTGAFGYPDINGHGTNAVYDCPACPGGNCTDIPLGYPQNTLTTPISPDPCTYPCASGQGYDVKNYDPCANFSCTSQDPNAYPPFSNNPNYATDYNIGHTYWDGTNTWGLPTYVFDNSLYGTPANWGPFGNTECCLKAVDVGPRPMNPDITYDFRPMHPGLTGGIQMFSTDDPNVIGRLNSINTGPSDKMKIGGTYFNYHVSRWDVVGNTQFPWNFGDYENTVVYGAPSTIPVTPVIPPAGCCQIPGQPAGTFYLFPPPSCTDTETLRIYIYDVYKNLIWDGEYKFICTSGLLSCPRPPSNEPCWVKSPAMKLVTEHFSINPGQIIDLALIGDVTGAQASSPGSGWWCCDSFPTGIGMAAGLKNGVGYVRLDSNISGTTVDTQNIVPVGSWYSGFAPRIPSTHWTPPGASSPSSRGNTANLTNMWTGQDLNWDAVNNPFTPGTQMPHACHDCGGSGYGKYAHWLEPGSATWTPGDFFYNNPFLLPNASSVHPDYATATINCPRAAAFNGGGSEGEMNSSLGGDCEEAISIKTNITYSEDENQKVTLSSADTATPAQTTFTPPPPPPPPTPTPTPPSTTPPPTTMTGDGGY